MHLIGANHGVQLAGYEEKGTLVQNVLNVRLGTEPRPQLDLLTIALMPGPKIRLANLKIFVMSRKLHSN